MHETTQMNSNAGAAASRATLTSHTAPPTTMTLVGHLQKMQPKANQVSPQLQNPEQAPAPPGLHPYTDDKQPSHAALQKQGPDSGMQATNGPKQMQYLS